MGLLDSGGKGNSHAQTTSNSQTTNTETTVNNVDNRVYTSDMGAISGAVDISRAAVDLGNHALDSQAQVSIAGLDAAQAFNANSLDFAKSLFSSAVAAGSGLLDQSIRGITDIGTQVSQSAAQSNNETVQKIVLYIAIGAALVFGLPAIAKLVKS